MAFQLSPGVQINEIDLTNVVPAVATSIGGFVGFFRWGPALDIETVSHQNELVSKFGKPDDITATSFFSASNFLDYTNNLRIVRVVGSEALNATADGNGLLIQNYAEYEQNYINGLATSGMFAAKYPGVLGNGIKILMCDRWNYSKWAYKAEFPSMPNNPLGKTDPVEINANDEMHIMVIDSLGKFTGTKGAILEKFPFVSRAFDAKYRDGTSSYYKNVLNRSSKYVYWLDHPADAEYLTDTNTGEILGEVWGSEKGTTFRDLAAPIDVTLGGGADDNSNSTTLSSDLMEGWQLFQDAEAIDVNLLFVGDADHTVAKYVIENVAEYRKDCVAFVSPSREACVNNSNALEAVLEWRLDPGFNVSSSYGAMDSGWKYQHDKYNDVYRWIPLNADMAGLHARTDSTNDAWWAAGGLNRGQIKNVSKLSWNPNQTARDELYQAGINPVTAFKGQGTVLFGNKTLLAKPSAFDRINVRRLFIVLEKAISKAARYMLFEFNDPFTRSQFISMVSPYLRMIQGRRGITAFKVVCDETNNDDQIVSTNQFIADIFIKPNYVAEFITLNFIGTNNTALFSEQG